MFSRNVDESRSRGILNNPVESLELIYRSFYVQT